MPYVPFNLFKHLSGDCKSISILMWILKMTGEYFCRSETTGKQELVNSWVAISDIKLDAIYVAAFKSFEEVADQSRPVTLSLSVRSYSKPL
jgi:hypothetical protein